MGWVCVVFYLLTRCPGGQQRFTHYVCVCEIKYINQLHPARMGYGSCWVFPALFSSPILSPNDISPHRGAGSCRQGGAPRSPSPHYTLCDPCLVSIYSPGDRREIMNTHSESPKEEFRVMELPQSGKMQPRIIDPIYPLVTQSRSRLDSSHLGSK